MHACQRELSGDANSQRRSGLTVTRCPHLFSGREGDLLGSIHVKPRNRTARAAGLNGFLPWFHIRSLPGSFDKQHGTEAPRCGSQAATGGTR